MTSQKQLKARVRARMAKTGERYAVARRHVVDVGTGSPVSHQPVVDHGWHLFGGTDPHAAALTNVLANRGVHGPDGPISEALVFAVAGGPGAGYILWEFKHDDSRHVTLGFSHKWQYFDARFPAASERLGLDVDWHRTGGSTAAATRLRQEIDIGHAVVIWPDRFHLGYWHLPSWLDGHGGHPVVAYVASGGRMHLDDRNLAPLTVADGDLDRARARVGSYRNAAFVVRSRDTTIGGAALARAVRAGLLVTVEHLSGGSDSFSLPAWRKWSRLLVDQRNVKAWPNVFADRRGLLGALLSVWEGVSAAGMTGGNLRDLFADALDEAADLLDVPALTAEATRWRELAASWHGFAGAAARTDVPEIVRARELTAAVTGAIAEGDEAAAERAEAAEELWRLRATHTLAPPFAPELDREIFAAMSEHLVSIFHAETAAVARLGSLLS